MAVPWAENKARSSMPLLSCHQLAPRYTCRVERATTLPAADAILVRKHTSAAMRLSYPHPLSFSAFLEESRLNGRLMLLHDLSASNLFLSS